MTDLLVSCKQKFASAELSLSPRLQSIDSVFRNMSFHFSRLSFQALNFPSITFCNLNPILKSKLEDLPGKTKDGMDQFINPSKEICRLFYIYFVHYCWITLGLMYQLLNSYKYFFSVIMFLDIKYHKARISKVGYWEAKRHNMQWVEYRNIETCQQQPFSCNDNKYYKLTVQLTEWNCLCNLNCRKILNNSHDNAVIESLVNHDSTNKLN